VLLRLQALLVSYVVLVSLFMVNSGWGLLEALAALPRRTLRPVLDGDREVRGKQPNGRVELRMP